MPLLLRAFALIEVLKSKNIQIDIQMTPSGPNMEPRMIFLIHLKPCRNRPHVFESCKTITLEAFKSLRFRVGSDLIPVPFLSFGLQLFRLTSGFGFSIFMLPRPPIHHQAFNAKTRCALQHRALLELSVCAFSGVLLK